MWYKIWTGVFGMCVCVCACQMRDFGGIQNLYAVVVMDVVFGTQVVALNVVLFICGAHVCLNVHFSHGGNKQT